MVKELCEHFEAGKQLSRYPYEMLDENKWLAARHGLDGELVDLPDSDRVPIRSWRGGCSTGCAPHAEELGSADDLDGLEDLLDNGNGASRQVVVYEANHDLREVVGEIVETTVPEARRGDRRVAAGTALARRRVLCRAVTQPDLFVVCKNCGSEVSPYVTECPYCGQRVRKRAPKIDRSGRRGPQTQRRGAAPKLPRLRAERDRGHRARHAAVRDARA